MTDKKYQHQVKKKCLVKLKKTASNLLERYMENLLKLLKALSQNDCWGSHTHTIMQSIHYFYF